MIDQLPLFPDLPRFRVRKGRQRIYTDEERKRRNRESRARYNERERMKDKKIHKSVDYVGGSLNRLGELGILTPRRVDQQADSHCGFDVYDVQASRAGHDGWLGIGEGCYQAHPTEITLIEELQADIEDSDFGLLFL